MVQPATFFHYSNPIQKPFDAAVVIPTTCRPSLVRAVHSVFHQVGVQRIHTLIGIDAVRGNDAVIDEILDTRPAQHAVTVLLARRLSPCCSSGSRSARRFATPMPDDLAARH